MQLDVATLQRSKQITNAQANTPFLWRLFAFIIGFVIASGIIGPRIIAHGLVGKYGFGIYGGAGKALLFSAIVLLLLVYRREANVKLLPWRRIQVLWFIAVTVSLASTWLGVGHLIAGASGIKWVLDAHVSIIATIVFITLGVFGITNIRTLGKTYKRELLIAGILAVAFYGFLYGVYELWQVLATIVLHTVSWLLGVSGLQSVIIPPYTLLLSKFAVQIAKYCSGIDSIALFSGLYAVVGLLDWKRFNHRRFLAAFVPALTLLFVLNILRVYGLILAGYYINPQIAFSLFHTYAGMLFFIIYSVIFWGIVYRWMVSPEPQTGDNTR